MNIRFLILLGVVAVSASVACAGGPAPTPVPLQDAPVARIAVFSESISGIGTTPDRDVSPSPSEAAGPSPTATLPTAVGVLDPTETPPAAVAVPTATKASGIGTTPDRDVSPSPSEAAGPSPTATLPTAAGVLSPTETPPAAVAVPMATKTSGVGTTPDRGVSPPPAASPTVPARLSPTPTRSQAPATLGEFVFEDIFGRRLNEKGITLVDWDGHIANPAMKLIIKPPENAAFPVQAVLTSTEPRLYFNLPSRDPGTLRSDVGREGPRQTFQFGGGQTVWTSYVAIFPDRDAIDEDHLITVQFMDKAGKTASGDLMVRVIDQDRSDPLRFNVIVDFSLDQTRFFADERARNTVTQAANDWAFFIDDMALNEVPADAEIYWTFNPDFETGAYSKNSAPYRGFFLNVFGVRSDKYLKSGGAPSPGGLQASGGVELPLKRSGHVGIEAAGNFNKLGWILTPDDKEWWVADYRNNLPTDLYSIALHEIGHALIFNPDHPGFGRFAAHVTGGSVDGPQVVAYQGAPVYVHGSSHLVGGIDKASKKGAFGYGEAGTNAPGIIMPPRRWLITKLDLLVAQAAGYKIRQTSAFVPLAISTSSLANGTVSAPYRATLEAAGGVPLYYWVVESGELPAGLTLDSFSGTISGTPIRAGTLEFTVRVRDYHEGSAVIVAPLRITIGPR